MKLTVPSCRTLAAAVLAMMLCLTSDSAARPWPDTTNGIYVFNDQLTGSMGAPLVEFSATHYAGCQKMLRSDADSLRSYNPNFLILHYRLGLGLGYKLPDAHGDPTGPYLMIIEGNEWVREWPDVPQNEWFYSYGGSPRVYNNMWGWYIIDPDDAAWRAYWLGEVTRQIAANDDDGLFADSVSVPNYLDPYTFTPNLPVIDPVFESDWSARIERWTSWVKTGLGAGYKLIPNVGFWVTTRDTTNYSGADGAMIEGFGMWGQTDPFELVDWQLQMNRILSLVAQNKVLIAQAYIDRPDDMSYRSFIIANYLLIKGTQTFVNLDMGYEPEWFPEYGADVGAFSGGIPAGIGELYRDDWGVYAREYSNGLALVNPSGEAKSFDVGPGYQLVVAHGGGLVPENGDISSMYLTYTPTGEITLEPYSGAVLVKSAVPPGHLTVTPSTGFSSSGPEGGPFSPPSTQYTLTNTGGESIDWSATHLPSGNWLTVAPTAGTLGAGDSAIVTISINSNASSLGSGTYNDTLTFTNTTNGEGNTARAVQLTVAGVQPAGMLVSPLGGLVSSGPFGGPFSPDRLQYTVSNTGASALDFVVTNGAGENWLSLCRTLSPEGRATVTAWINDLASALGPGVYSDTIAFANITTGAGDTTRDVQLTVLQGALSVAPADGLSSSGQVGGPFSPSSKDYTLTNTGTASINWTATHNPAANWVTLSDTSGTLAPSASTVVTVSINSNADLLPAATYNDTVTFTNTTNGDGDTTRGVQLAVVQGALSVAPAEGLSSSGPVGGPFSPSSKIYTLSNTGTGSINWTATHLPSVNWITLSSTSGTLAAGGNTTVTVSINSNANSLPEGAYADTVTFTNTTNGIGNTTRPVDLTIASKTLTSVVVTPSNLSCPSNDPRQLHATAYFSDSSSLDITSLGTWSSSKTSVCTVSMAGLVTPVSKGNANVTCSYTYSGTTKTAKCSVSINYQTIWYLYLSPASYVFYTGTPAQFNCKARSTTGWIDVTEVCQWVSSNPAAATVSWTGLVTPVSGGYSTITARYLYNGSYLAASANVQVSF